jgi:multiple antibiotic resistance protein
MSVLEALVQSPAAATDASHAYMMGSSEVFLFFFIMLGPLKLIGPYYAQTRALDAAAMRMMAWKVFALGVIAVLTAGLLGGALLRKWQIAPPVMEFAGGLVFLLVALQMVLSQYDEPQTQAQEFQPQLLRLVFPVTVTPYGVATVIVLMALSADLQRSLSVLGIAVAVMVLNLLAMLFVRAIIKGTGVLSLQILGAVLGILQVALALQLMAQALRSMGVNLTL